MLYKYKQYIFLYTAIYIINRFYFTFYLCQKIKTIFFPLLSGMQLTWTSLGHLHVDQN